MRIFEPFFASLNDACVRYVVVGGVAVVLHGFARLTGDIDLVIDLRREEAEKTIRCLTSLGMKARLPVDPLDFADAETRNRWIEEKGMRVFTMLDPGNPMRQVDLLAECPLSFEELFSRSEQVALTETWVRVASIPDLIRMKEVACRPQDRADIEALRAILRTKEQSR